MEAVEDAEWRGRELPDCGPHVLDVPHGGPLTSLVITIITSEQCLVSGQQGFNKSNQSS